jgi:putative Mn2+ efflux pump MntP
MISLTIAALFLSIDSFVASFALGACRIERRQQHWLAVAFGVCDGAASLGSLLLGELLASKLAVFGHWGGPVLLGTYAVFVAVLARLRRAVDESGSPKGAQMLYILPVLMSLDNLTASFAFLRSGSSILCFLVIASVSGLVSICGFRAGEAIRRLRRVVRIRWECLCLDGPVLLAAAVLLAID